MINSCRDPMRSRHVTAAYKILQNTRQSLSACIPPRCRLTKASLRKALLRWVFTRIAHDYVSEYSTTM